MNPLLLEQIINLIGLGIVELRAVSANDAVNDAFTPVLKQALAENRALTPDELAPIEAVADDAHQGVQNA